jgi:cytochrome c5
MSGRYKPTLWRICLFAGLLHSSIVSFLHADTLTLPAVAAASIDGSPTAANFALTVAAVSSTARLSTQQLLDLSVAFRPDSANIGQMGSVFAVFVKNDAFFLLGPDRSFTPWNGEVETLLPFLQEVPLTETSSVHLLAGRLSDPGEYQIFTAYAAQGEAVLKFTPEPFTLMLTSTAQSPELDEAAAIYQAQVESRVVQTRCIVCHVEGGVARNSPLKFQRNMAGAVLNNINTLTSYLGRDGNSVETFLNKASGGSGHPGGQQLVRGSQDYQAFERVMRLLEADREQQNQGIAYRFEPGTPPPRPADGSLALLSSVELAPREATLRRASILLTGRVPTAEALQAVREGDANTLREALRALMAGPEFREFIVNAANERLLTRGADDPINSGFSNFPLLRNLVYDTVMAGKDYWQEYGHQLRESTIRASGELIAHVVINELPYSEILTANYMMMNPLLNQYLGGTATFPPAAGAQDFLPSRITQYYLAPEVVISKEREFFGSIEAGHKVLSTGTPVADYPHSGLLTDFAFLSRYPTTATNRNRARARWTLYHFLGIDIEKSSQRPLDEASLSDRNNPTMNNPNCTVCHAVLDPVAGAFQNWSEWNMYREGGYDTLDHFYKHPSDGSISPYRPGDLWYRDMRLPGLFETTLSSRDYTLRELANAIVNEPGFMTAAVRFWWPAIFGESLVTLPSVESDQGFAERSAAYAAQQATVAEFARLLGERGNAKDMLVEMMMSPWFTAQSARRHEFRGVQLEANLGAPRLLGPAQLAAKTLNLTGVNWRTHTSPSGRTWSDYQNMSVMLGGIDSVTVLERATVLTPTIFAVQQAIMAEMSCPAVVKDFALPLAKRRMFSLVDETITPMTLANGTFDVTSAAREQWQQITLPVTLPAEPISIQVSFANPYCDYDGVRCVEQRVLYLQGLTLRAGSEERRFLMNSPEISVSGQNCYQQGPEATFYSECTMRLDLHLDTPIDIEVTAHVSAQQAPSRAEPVRASIEVFSKADILMASTPNARLIKEQIVELIQRFHGRTVAIDSSEVQQVYSLFAVALESARLSGRGSFNVCHWYTDGNFLSDLLSPEQLKLARQPSPDGDWWRDDWNYLGPVMRDWMNDLTGAKRGWIAVIAYLMTHYDYVHE